MDEKVKIVVELDKATAQGAGYFGNVQLTDELWNRMVAEPILFPMEVMEEQRKAMEVAMAMVAIGLTLKKMEDKQ